MRTTIDLPDALHDRLTALARDRHQSLSNAVVDLVERGLDGSTGSRPGSITINPRTGLPVLHVDRIITTEDVRALEDDE